MADTSRMLYLPDMLAKWPWKRDINPYYAEVGAESSAWLRSFQAFSSQSQYAFDKCDCPRLAALAYPLVSKGKLIERMTGTIHTDNMDVEHLRTSCDLVNLFFVIDEYTDVEPESVVRSMVDTVIDALKNPHKPRPEGEVILGEIARQFWKLAIKTATATSQRHMIDAFIAYLETVVEQARDRDYDKYRSVHSYFENRRENIGTRPSFAIFELGFDVPDDVLNHSVIKELVRLSTDMIILGNDMVSYNKEQAAGDDRHNILTVIMNEFNVGLEEAQAWVVNHHTNLEKQFLDSLKHVPSWVPDIDTQVQQYLDGVRNWVRATDCWNFESGRYFGNLGLTIQKTRQVPLLSKKGRPTTY